MLDNICLQVGCDETLSTAYKQLFDLYNKRNGFYTS